MKRFLTAFVLTIAISAAVAAPSKPSTTYKAVSPAKATPAFSYKPTSTSSSTAPSRATPPETPEAPKHTPVAAAKSASSATKQTAQPIKTASSFASSAGSPPPASTQPAPQTVVVHKQSSSFWSPFILGYMVAPHSTHATPAAHHTTPSPGAPQTLMDASGAISGPAGDRDMNITVPQTEMFDKNCQLQPGAKEFFDKLAWSQPQPDLTIAIPVRSACSAQLVHQAVPNAAIKPATGKDFKVVIVHL